MAYTVEKDWVEEGLRCVVVAVDIGHRCGYVGIPPSHPLWKVEYGEPCDILKEAHKKAMEGKIGKRGIIPLICAGDEPRPDVVFDVHGGITYSAGGDYPVKQTEDLWWFGFDCGHSGDARDPGLMSDEQRAVWSNLYNEGVVRELPYVEEETKQFAHQLAAFSGEDL